MGIEVVAERHLGISVNHDFAQVEPERLLALMREVAPAGRRPSPPSAPTCALRRWPSASRRELDIPLLDTVSTTVWGMLRAGRRPTRRRCAAGVGCSAGTEIHGTTAPMPSKNRGRRCPYPVARVPLPDTACRRHRAQARLAASRAREHRTTRSTRRIYVAILEHRLQPGTKLGEERLAEIFGVSRARVREVLARLAHEQIVELYPAARRLRRQALDRAGARRVRGAPADRAGRAAPPDRHAHAGEDRPSAPAPGTGNDARRRDDKRAMVRLSGEFHTLAAELAGNSAWRAACASCAC